MDDPIKPVIDKIKNSQRLKTFWEHNRDRREPFTDNFLNKVAEAFEQHGFEITRTFLLDKRQRQATKYQADVLLEILDYLNIKHIQRNRSVGRIIIKALNAIEPE